MTFDPPGQPRPPVYRWPPPGGAYRPRLVPWLRRRRRGCLLLVVLAGLALGLGLAKLSRPFGPRSEATLLVLGADQGREHGGGARADTILLVRVRLDPPSATGLSLPRDTRVRIPGRRGRHKLNAAFAFGGVELTRRTIAETFEVVPDHHLVIYSAGLAGLVDAVGGIVVDVPKAMDYDDKAQDLHIHLRPGRQRLGGTEAVGFVRFRSDARADLGRIERQQVFLKALVKQAVRPSLLWRWPRVVAALRRGLESDLALSQLLGLAWSMRGVSREALQFSTLPGRPGSRGGVSYYLPDELDLAAALAPKSGRTSVAVTVLNGSGRQGEAAAAASRLRAAGLKVGSIGNAAGHVRRTELHHPPGAEFRGVLETLRNALGRVGAVEDEQVPADGPWIVVIGEDYRAPR